MSESANNSKNIQDIRREYGCNSFKREDLDPNPICQFELWLSAAIESGQPDPTAFVLATVDQDACPDTRILLLKGIQDDKFIFYTNYDSAKGQEIEENPAVALNFYWRALSRQIRIKGRAQKTTTKMSDEYFASRPRDSQLSAVASKQSSVIERPEIIEEIAKKLSAQYPEDSDVPRPEAWGGYEMVATEFEFWQGCDQRRHVRWRYRQQSDASWKIECLAP